MSYPSGSVAISSWIWAARAASSTSSSLASGFAKRRFSRTDAWKRYVSCETTPTVAASDSNVSSRTSTPSIATTPCVASYSRATRYAHVVFPEPVSPTSAVFVPGGTRKDTSWSVHAASS